MDEISRMLTAIEPLLRSLADGKAEFYEELRQSAACAMAERLSNGKTITPPICVGIARNIAHDMLCEQQQRRQRFISLADIEGWERDGDLRVHVAGHRPVFDAVWEKLSCESLRCAVKNWRNSLRLQERRVLRGLRRGATQAQMAAREGVAPGTIAAWVHRSRRKLEATL